MDNIQILNRTISLEQIRLGVMGACGVLCLWMLYSQTYPRVQDYLGMRAENEQKRQEIEAMKRETRNIAQLQYDLSRVRHNLARVRDRFPPRAQILSTLLVDLSDLFKQCDCELTNFGPGDPQPLNTGSSSEIMRDLSILPVSITARGSYSSLITLFERLSKYERVLDMQELTLTPESEGEKVFSNKLGIQFTLTTYVLNR